MNSTERQILSDQLEDCRAAILTIDKAAHDLKNCTDDLEWALMMTDPATVVEHVNFNQSYADRELDARARRWRAARDELRHALDQRAQQI